MAKHDYNNPLDQMKAISYNLKRVADALEEISQHLETNKPNKMSDTFAYEPMQEKTGSIYDQLKRMHNGT